MSSTALKIGAVITLLLAVVLAVIGARVAQRYASDAEQAKAEAERVQEAQAAQTLAVVAVKPLAAYASIQPDDVALVPVHTAPPNYFASVEDVVGRSPLVDVDVGAPVTPRYFREGNQLARNIPAKHKAVSLEVDDVIAVGGFVRPGDVVDVLLYVRGGGSLGEPQARQLLEAARVLAYNEQLIDRPEGLQEQQAGNNQDRRRRQRTVVLAVPDEHATRLMLGASLGDLRLAMHSQRQLDAEANAEDQGLPISESAKAEREAQKVPDQAVTASRLVAVEKPPAEQKKKKPPPPPKVTVHRGSSQEEVRP